MCVGALTACVSVHHICAWCPRRQEEAADSPRTGVVDDCGLSCGCWDLSPALLEEQPELLTTDSPLQPYDKFYIVHTF